jgi:hypothetical protein
VELLVHLLFDHHCTVREALTTLVDVRPIVMA